MDGENLAHAGTGEEYASSPPPADLPPQELQDPIAFDMTGPFEPEMLANLPQLSVQQLSKLEEQISEEFATLAQEYVVARKPRIDYMHKSVDAQIKKFQQNDSSWSNFYNRQVQLIETLTHLTENQIIKENMGSRHHSKNHPSNSLDFDSELSHLIATLESPLEFDDVFKTRMSDLPMGEYFEEIIYLHMNQLTASSNQVRYHKQLIESITEKNRVIKVKQYRKDVLEFKDKLIDETRDQLEKLHKEYYGISSAHDTAVNDIHYYRSLVPVTNVNREPRNGSRILSTGNHDTYHGIDNVYHRNHRIEITDAKRKAQSDMDRFETSQTIYKIPQLDTVAVKLGGCMGLTQEEGDADLALIRSHGKPLPEEEIHSDGPFDVDADADIDVDMDESYCSPFSPEVAFDSEEEDYHNILNINRQPTQVRTGTDIK